MCVSIRGFLALAILTSIPFHVTARVLGANPEVLDSGEQFGVQGRSVDISGNLAIVGANDSAFIFDLTTGNLLHRLKATDYSDQFGSSVAIDGGLAVVASGQSNAAYIFDTSTGQQLHKLTPTTRPSDYVRSVDISNGVVVLGTPTVEFAGDFVSDYGAAFLYNALTGNQIKRINGPTTYGKGGFGSSVAIEGGTVAITSPSSQGFGDVYAVDSQTGEVRWTYGRSTTGGAFYAKDVAIDGDRIVVGGGAAFIYSSPGYTDMPTAYVIDRSSGALIREIDMRTAVVNDGDRAQLDVSGNRLVVGSLGVYSEKGYYTGAAHLFNVATGQFLGTFHNPVPTAFDSFGSAVALENERLLIGAPGAGDRGLTYSFNLVPEPTTVGMAVLASLLCFSQKFGRRSRSRSEGKTPRRPAPGRYSRYAG